MHLRPSRLLRKIRGGETATVFKLNLVDARVAELAALAPVDAIWLCREHVPNDWLNVENMIRAARVHDCDSIVRISKGSYSDYITAFEAGATGIMVPHVASADEAREIVEMCRFHPLGCRPIDGGNIDGAFCQVAPADYIAEANREQLLIFQIESPEALEQVDAIAAVPGFDGLLFGAGDFSHRIGKVGQVQDAVVAEARRRVAQAARTHGKFAMTPGALAPWETQVEEGYNVLTLGADVIGLGEYFRGKAAELAKLPLSSISSVYR